MWSEQEKQFLRDNMESMTVNELAPELLKISGNMKSGQSIRGMCQRMGVHPKRDDGNRWTDAELEYLYDNRELRVKELSRHLGRGEKAITVKIYHEGFLYGKMKQVTPWMTSMLDKIPSTGKSIYEISTELYEAGRRVEIESNAKHQMAVFCRERNYGNISTTGP